MTTYVILEDGFLVYNNCRFDTKDGTYRIIDIGDNSIKAIYTRVVGVTLRYPSHRSW